MDTIANLDDIATPWAEFMLRGLVDGSIVFVVVLLLWLCVRRFASVHLAYGLFLLVLVKLVVPIHLSVPTAVAAVFPSYVLENAVNDWADAPEQVTFQPGAAPVASIPEVAPPPAQPVWSLETALLLAWGTVVGILLLRLLHMQIRTLRAVSRARPATRSELPDDPRVLLQTAGLRRRVRFLVTDAVTTPAAGGLLRSYVLLPDGFAQRLPPQQLSWVVFHELAHIRRGDLWIALLQRLVQISFFFHPVVWVANRIIDEQREYACDDTALGWSKARPGECGAGFLSVVEWSLDRSSVPVATLGVFDSKSLIRRRLMRMMDGRIKNGRRTRALSGAMLLGVALLVLPTVSAQAVVVEPQVVTQDPPPVPTRQDPPPPPVQDPERRRALQRLTEQLDRLERENEALRREIEAMENRGPAAGSRGARGGVNRVDVAPVPTPQGLRGGRGRGARGGVNRVDVAPVPTPQGLRGGRGRGARGGVNRVDTPPDPQQQGARGGAGTGTGRRGGRGGAGRVDVTDPQQQGVRSGPGTGTGRRGGRGGAGRVDVTDPQQQGARSGPGTGTGRRGGRGGAGRVDVTVTAGPERGAGADAEINRLREELERARVRTQEQLSELGRELERVRAEVQREIERARQEIDRARQGGRGRGTGSGRGGVIRTEGETEPTPAGVGGSAGGTAKGVGSGG